jgi:hypothetical protein
VAASIALYLSHVKSGEYSHIWFSPGADLGPGPSGPGRSPKVLLFIGFFPAKKSCLKYISAQKCGPKDLLLVAIEPGADGFP